jgi:hypothetical protein
MDSIARLAPLWPALAAVNRRFAKTTQKQPLIHHMIHHDQALPISAVFRLRYVDTLVRIWAALGMYDGRMP